MGGIVVSARQKACEAGQLERQLDKMTTARQLHFTHRLLRKVGINQNKLMWGKECEVGIKVAV